MRPNINVFIKASFAFENTTSVLFLISERIDVTGLFPQTSVVFGLGPFSLSAMWQLSVVFCSLFSCLAQKNACNCSVLAYTKTKKVARLTQGLPYKSCVPHCRGIKSIQTAFSALFSFPMVSVFLCAGQK